MDRKDYVKRLTEALGDEIVMLGGEIRPHDLVCTDDHLTEQEHIPLCDVNRMVKNAMKGQAVLTANSQPVYGYDDTTMDGHNLRIQKRALEEELQNFADNNEVSEDEAKHIPEAIQQKFKIRVKKSAAVDKTMGAIKTPNEVKHADTEKTPD